MIPGETPFLTLHIFVTKHCKFLVRLVTCPKTGAFENYVS